MTIGERIRYYREIRGITQDKLAKLSGISLSGIKKYELNICSPKPEHLEKVATALSISPLVLRDVTPETVGDCAHLFFALAKAGGLQIHGNINPETGKYEDNISFSFSSSSLNYFLKEWADGKAVVDHLRSQAETSHDEIAKQMLLQRADEIENTLELKIQDSSVLVTK